jgi:hypothetical protein
MRLISSRLSREKGRDDRKKAVERPPWRSCFLTQSITRPPDAHPTSWFAIHARSPRFRIHLYEPRFSLPSPRPPRPPRPPLPVPACASHFISAFPMATRFQLFYPTSPVVTRFPHLFSYSLIMASRILSPFVLSHLQQKASRNNT